MTNYEFGMTRKDLLLAKYYSYDRIDVGDYENLKKLANAYNRLAKRLGRAEKYFVWPIPGWFRVCQLVRGHLD